MANLTVNDPRFARWGTIKIYTINTSFTRGHSHILCSFLGDVRKMKQIDIDVSLPTDIKSFRLGLSILTQHKWAPKLLTSGKQWEFVHNVCLFFCSG